MPSNIESICTYLDVVALIPQLYDEEEKEFIFHPSEIRSYIFLNDSQLRAQLKPILGTTISTTPRADVPTKGKSNEGNGFLLLTDGTELLTVSTSSSVKSQVYEFKFTTATAFTCTSDLSGSQGTGATSGDFTTTDTFLTIPTELWNGTFVAGDIVYVRLFNYEGLLVHLSALLTAKYILDTIFTEEVPDASATAQRYERLYNSLIASILDGTTLLEGGISQRDISPIQVDYEIDEYGNDVTNYADLDWDKRLS